MSETSSTDESSIQPKTDSEGRPYCPSKPLESRDFGWIILAFVLSGFVFSFPFITVFATRSRFATDATSGGSHSWRGKALRAVVQTVAQAA